MHKKKIISKHERRRVDEALGAMNQIPIHGAIEEALAASTFRAHQPRDLGLVAVNIVSLGALGISFLSLLGARSTPDPVLFIASIYLLAATITMLFIAVLAYRSTHAAAARRIVEHRISESAEIVSAIRVQGSPLDNRIFRHGGGGPRRFRQRW